MNENSVNIRNVQHYMYCPRQFALIEVNRDWAINGLVAFADIMHEHVHDGTHSYSDREKIVRSSIVIYNDEPEYNLFGVTDCAEFVRNKNGVEIPYADGRFNVRLVEYKPHAPNGLPFNETDAIQVYAQKVCADYVWGCDSEAYLYYIDTRKRVKLPFDEDSEREKYDTMLKDYIKQIQGIIDRHEIPARKKAQKCSGCSMKDICFYKEKKKKVRDVIMSLKEGE